MTTVRFNVLGTPKPQGSKVPIRNKQRQIVGSREAGGVELEHWRSAVAQAAQKAARDTLGCIRGPVAVAVTFRFAMPAARPARFRQFGMYRVSTPDSDKLERALGDAMKVGGLIEEDARIVVWHVDKIEVWQQWTGAIVQVSSLDLIPARLVTDISTDDEQRAADRAQQARLEL